MSASAMTYDIIGGDYERAGEASRALKESLKRVGIAPSDLRRAMIAAYEAEMNVVIHARHGVMRCKIGDGLLEVEVADEGPGIADIEQAMKEGFSTAPPEARRLGFGAGMGLPNVKKAVDRLDIQSKPGEGTTLRFNVKFSAQRGKLSADNSLKTTPGVCIGCMRCLHACPTGAMRVHKCRPTILEHLCIDCASCIESCRTGALAMADADAELPADRGLIVIPAAFLVEFGPSVSPERVLAVLERLGFREVWVSDLWQDALREAVLGYAGGGGGPVPVLSPVCPAAMNLVALRYPSLLANVAPYLYPAEAVAAELKGRRAHVVAQCPAWRTVLNKAGLGDGVTVAGPTSLRCAVLPLVSDAAPGDDPLSAVPNHHRHVEPHGLMQVSNVRHDMGVLEKAENGHLEDIEVLELYACDGGCFGSPLMTENSYIGRKRWQKSRPVAVGGPARAIWRQAPLTPRRGLRLDSDVSRAVEKLAEIEEAARKLPGRDCAMCGAPSCAAMAEDVVLGRARIEECVYLAAKRGKKR